MFPWINSTLAMLVRFAFLPFCLTAVASAQLANVPSDMYVQSSRQRAGRADAAVQQPDYQRPYQPPRLLPQYESDARQVRVTGHGVGNPSTSASRSARGDQPRSSREPSQVVDSSIDYGIQRPMRHRTINRSYAVNSEEQQSASAEMSRHEIAGPRLAGPRLARQDSYESDPLINPMDDPAPGATGTRRAGRFTTVSQESDFQESGIEEIYTDGSTEELPAPLLDPRETMQYQQQHMGHPGMRPNGMSQPDAPWQAPYPSVDCSGRGCGNGCGEVGCNDCNTCNSSNDCVPCGDRVGWYFAKDMTLFGGVHGFKNRVDPDTGAFGFQEGINWSMPILDEYGIGLQAGAQAMQNDLNSSESSEGNRSQTFFTTGLFQRQMCDQGWQWGVVYDHLFDEFDESFDVGQVRGELSHLFRGNEFGFWFATGVSNSGSDNLNNNVINYETESLYAFFLRRKLLNCGEGRLWGGFTGNSNGMFGGDFRQPIASDWDLTAGFNYIAAGNDTNEPALESWNIGINLAWYICRNGALKAGSSPYRPLFGVADNGTLIAQPGR